MALPNSTVAQACRAVADHVKKALGNEAKVLIGPPATATPAASDSEHRVNLFFHRFEPSAVGAEYHPGQPYWLRIHCVITVFGTEETSGQQVISAGENDLRLIGEVIRNFHEEPVLTLTIDSEPVQIQMIPAPLSLDDVNRLWSTQKDATYRPSIAYEVALVPVLPLKSAIAPPQVSALGVGVGPKNAEVSVRPAAPSYFSPLPVDTSRTDWAPQIGFVVADGCVQTLDFSASDPALSVNLPIAVAGAPDAKVTLHWQVWDSVQGWRDAAPNDGLPQYTIDKDRLEPEPSMEIALPSSSTGQALLHAMRTWERQDGAIISIRSNPLLVTIHGDAS